MQKTFLSGALPLILIASLEGAPPSPSSTAPAPSGSSSRRSGRADEEKVASAEVEKALERELAGDNAARQSILNKLVADKPESPQAHWHLGEVRVGDKWLPYDRVGDEGDRWQELYRYGEQRAKRKQTVDDQLFLADGARAHGLLDQERAHLMQVVAINPAHEEAHRRLGDYFSEADGTWIARERFVGAVQSQRRWLESLARYGKEAEKFTSRLRRLSPQGLEKSREEWDAWRDPEKLPALEQAVGDSGGALQTEYVRWLGSLDCYEASRALVRQTLFSENEAVRLMATDTLKDRPWEDYMHELVASVTSVRETTDPVAVPAFNAQVTSLTWETMDSVVETQWLLRNPIDVLQIPGFMLKVDNHRNAGVAAGAVWQAVQKVRADGDAPRNERALRAISRLAGKKFKNAREAWEWWDKFQDAVREREKIERRYEDNWYVDSRRRTVRPSPVPVYQTTSVSFQINPPPPDPTRRCECLAAGTMIMTETGARPVETLEIGDGILAQDLETGELTFKPVVGKTIRERANLYRLKAGSDEIVCSQGHPFWVNAIGWVQARALQPGMPLHSPSGSGELTSVEPAGEGTVYNVIVADSHTYFVGKAQPVLSHDPTVRRATNALLPGLHPNWTGTPATTERPVTLK